ncbi:MAG TPA: GWxTD domain-containing protein [Candidatus Aminicenantes bacterium]|nr:GWxTD domain-containing protein [Candidatus Aminicenantes bacterium]HRY65707.1 GWxTD domain-containing protein [Candidatus Aminicenantes bacterium]HRZ72621.1 GWxTD domain-containing protein [Candidatus Aminicenantes bacterium]
MRRSVPFGPAAAGAAARGLAAAALLGLAPLLFPQTKPSDLPERYRTWLQEEVVYIITPGERNVFLDLSSDRQRELFIEAFWKHRDPSPGTDVNEFRDEHQKRLTYVNRMFRGAGRPGWKTDRGKVYIILGPPRTTRQFAGISTVYESEVWSYEGLEAPGIPSAIDLLFFKKNGGGDPVLYDPAGDGPWSLMSNYESSTGQYADSYEALSLIEPELARATISFVPGETVVHMPSLMSMAILQNLDAAAYRTVEDTYARKFREYKDVVEVEYTANYIDSGSMLQVLQDASGTSFIHYLIEPAGVSLGGGQSGAATDLIFNGILTDSLGRTVFQFEKKVPLSFTGQQYEKMRQRPLSFSGVFPVLPGEYRLAVLMKNSVSKEFTSLERAVKVEAAAAPRLAPLLLAFNAARLSPAPAGPRPYVVRDLQLYCQPGETFLTKERLFAHTQALGLPPQLRPAGTLRFTMESEEGVVAAKVQPLAGPGDIDFVETFPLESVKPGFYRIVAALFDGDGREIARQAKDFQVSGVGYLPRPWVISQSVMDGAPASLTDNILGRQWAAAGDEAKAVVLLERAYRASPGVRAFALDLARTYLALKRMTDVLAVLEPYLPEAEKDFDLGCLLADTRRALGRQAEALELYQALLSSFGLNARILNGIAESRLALGDRAAAVAAWKKSLEIDPSQTALKDRIAEAEKRR